jgi:uncharacterized protein
MEPLLANPEVLKVDCETNAKGDRIWIRVAFDTTEKGRIFGRNGRTIQAIRTLLTNAGHSHDQVVRFDVFDPDADPNDKPTPVVNSNKPKPKPKPKLESS